MPAPLTPHYPPAVHRENAADEIDRAIAALSPSLWVCGRMRGRRFPRPVFSAPAQRHAKAASAQPCPLPPYPSPSPPQPPSSTSTVSTVRVAPPSWVGRPASPAVESEPTSIVARRPSHVTPSVSLAAAAPPPPPPALPDPAPPVEKMAADVAVEEAEPSSPPAGSAAVLAAPCDTSDVSPSTITPDSEGQPVGSESSSSSSSDGGDSAFTRMQSVHPRDSARPQARINIFAHQKRFTPTSMAAGMRPGRQCLVAAPKYRQFMEPSEPLAPSSPGTQVETPLSVHDDPVAVVSPDRGAACLTKEERGEEEEEVGTAPSVDESGATEGVESSTHTTTPDVEVEEVTGSETTLSTLVSIPPSSPPHTIASIDGSDSAETILSARPHSAAASATAPSTPAPIAQPAELPLPATFQRAASANTDTTSRGLSAAAAVIAAPEAVCVAHPRATPWTGRQGPPPVAQPCPPSPLPASTSPPPATHSGDAPPAPTTSLTRRSLCRVPKAVRPPSASQVSAAASSSCPSTLPSYASAVSLAAPADEAAPLPPSRAPTPLAETTSSSSRSLLCRKPAAAREAAATLKAAGEVQLSVRPDGAPPSSPVLPFLTASEEQEPQAAVAPLPELPPPRLTAVAQEEARPVALEEGETSLLPRLTAHDAQEPTPVAPSRSDSPPPPRPPAAHEQEPPLVVEAAAPSPSTPAAPLDSTATPTVLTAEASSATAVPAKDSRDATRPLQSQPPPPARVDAPAKSPALPKPSTHMLPVNSQSSPFLRMTVMERFY